MCIAALSILLQGCKVLLPAHSNSNARVGESVNIQMLKWDAVEKGYKEDYLKAFKLKDFPAEPKPPQSFKPQVVPLVALAASAAVGFAVDYVQQQLKQEADLYQAQFGNTLADDQFWMLTQQGNAGKMTTYTTHQQTHSVVARLETNTPIATGVGIATKLETDMISSLDATNEVSKTFESYQQRYFGFQVTRKVKDDPMAFNLVCGIAPTHDQQLFRVAPLYFQTRKAKAKVLSDQWWTWPMFWTWGGKLTKTPEHHLNTKVDIEMDGYWKDKDQTMKINKLAILSLKFDGYDISSQKQNAAAPTEKAPPAQPNPIRAKDGTIKQAVSGFLVSVPVSLDPEGKPITSGEKLDALGTFTVKATVTESDASNAKQDLEQAAKWVSEQKPAILNLLPK